MPLAPLESRPVWLAHLAPLPIAAASCSLNLSSLSMITPRYFCIGDVVMWLSESSLMVIGGCLIHFLGLLGSTIFFLVSANAPLLCNSYNEWCVFPQSFGPPSLLNISSTLSPASSNESPHAPHTPSSAYVLPISSLLTLHVFI